jgi:Ca2+/Na+ antiporter
MTSVWNFNDHRNQNDDTLSYLSMVTRQCCCSTISAYSFSKSNSIHTSEEAIMKLNKSNEKKQQQYHYHSHLFSFLLELIIVSNKDYSYHWKDTSLFAYEEQKQVYLSSTMRWAQVLVYMQSWLYWSLVIWQQSFKVCIYLPGILATCASWFDKPCNGLCIYGFVSTNMYMLKWYRKMTIE